ncbi:MAG: ABC transporter permease [bacterium]|nr:ABC transporter permease [bacterium]
MNLQRIKGVYLQEFYITKRSIETLFDIVIIPILNIIVFGFLSIYLAGGGNTTASNTVLMGMLLWQTLFVMQYSITVPSLWNIWSRNLSNMFVSPLTVREYITAHAVTGMIKTIALLIISTIAINYYFNFNLLQLGVLPLIFIIFNLILFGITLGILLLGFIFRFGTKIQALAWGFISILQPLVAAFYPVEILPPIIRYVSYILPPTYIFEASRELLSKQGNGFNYLLFSTILSFIYLILAGFAFNKFFQKSKESGQFARNEA